MHAEQSDEVSGRLQKKAWLSPIGLLCLFCAMNMLVYLDRGVISSNGVNGSQATEIDSGTGIQGDFGLSLTQDGYLPAAFLVGLLVSSPIFAEASKHVNAFRLIAVGLGIWTLSTAGCGIAMGFWTLILCRMLVGVGEASFVALASPFIDDYAPPGAKSKWLAAFYLCIPVGYALGYIFGGVVAGPLGWRAAFLLEAAAMVPFVLFCALAPPISLKGMDKDNGKREEIAVGGKQRLWGKLKGAVCELAGDVVILCSHPVYLSTVAGQTLYTAYIGALAYLGPKAGRDVFSISGETADLIFGAVTVLTGVFGTLAGGIAMDRLGSTMPNGLMLCALGMLVGCGFILIAFEAAQGLAAFVPPFAAGQFSVFAIQAPNTAVVLWSVPSRLRPLAMSFQVIVIHVLGDVPSPPLLGLLQEHVQNWRLSIAITTLLLLVGAAFFWLGRWFCRTQPDYREVEAGDRAGHNSSAAAEQPEAPLLQNGHDQHATYV